MIMKKQYIYIYCLVIYEFYKDIIFFNFVNKFFAQANISFLRW